MTRPDATDGGLARAIGLAGFITLDEAKLLLGIALRGEHYDENRHMVTLHISLDMLVRTFELVERYGIGLQPDGVSPRIVFRRADPPDPITDYLEVAIVDTVDPT